MADLSDARSNIQVEETRFRAAVSEATQQKIGSSINFINNRQHSEKQWFINGSYDKFTTPFNDVDGYTFFQFDAFLIDVWMYVQGQSGATSGFTEIDLQYASTPGGSWTSIFTTKPRINYNAGSGVWIHVGSSVANTTAPTLAVTNVNAGWALRCCLNGVPVNLPTSGAGCGIIVHYRPR